MLFNVSLRQHLHLFYLVTTCWTFFFLGGLWSDYYRAWPDLLAVALIDLAPAALMTVLGPRLIRHTNARKPLQASWVIAFYFSVPFLVYDFIYLYLYLGRGLGYLLDYSHLTFFSLIPWITFPVTGYVLEGRQLSAPPSATPDRPRNGPP